MTSISSPLPTSWNLDIILAQDGGLSLCPNIFFPPNSNGFCWAGERPLNQLKMICLREFSLFLELGFLLFLYFFSLGRLES